MYSVGIIFVTVSCYITVYMYQIDTINSIQYVTGFVHRLKATSELSPPALRGTELVDGLKCGVSRTAGRGTALYNKICLFY